MKRFGINIDSAYGVSIRELRIIAKAIGKSHTLALELWKTKVHEAKVLASMVDNPNLVSSDQMDQWAKDFDSWDVCDECCINLFVKTPFAYEKATQWALLNDPFIKRAGFVLMATLVLHDKAADGDKFATFSNVIRANSGERRRIVKRAIAWALREIEKRNNADDR